MVDNYIHKQQERDWKEKSKKKKSDRKMNKCFYIVIILGEMWFEIHEASSNLGFVPMVDLYQVVQLLKSHCH